MMAKKKKNKKLGWGGARAGAGRPKGRSAHYVPHEARPRVRRSDVVLVKLRCREDVPSLRRATTRTALETLFGRIDRKRFRVVHYALKRDTLWLLCEAANAEELSRGVQGVASAVARTLNKLLDRRGRFFADRFATELFRTPTELGAALKRMFVSGKKVDVHSSAPWFDRWSKGVAVPKPRGERPVAEAQTELLKKVPRLRP